MDKNYGVINEQGFPVGDNLGFKPLSESEREHIEKSFEEVEKNRQSK